MGLERKLCELCMRQLFFPYSEVMPLIPDDWAEECGINTDDVPKSASQGSE